MLGVALLVSGLGWTAHRALATSSVDPARADAPVAIAAPQAISPAPDMVAAAATKRAPTSAIAPPLAIKAAARPKPVAAREHTGWAALDAAIARIPHYYPGIAHWHVADKGAWGATMLDTGDIYIAPRTPLADLYSVAVHEYGHAITGHLYGGFYPAQNVADRLFGQQGEYGLEIEADCMARVEGATWTNYTPCANSTWRAYARTLVTMHKP